MSTLCRSISLFVGLATLVLAGCGNSTTGSGTAAKPAATTEEEPAVTPGVDARLASSAVSTSRPAEVPGDGFRDGVLAATSSVQQQAAVFYIKTDPEILDLGEVAANDKPTGTVRLINTGDRTFKILGCKTNCGCTTTNCPRNKELAPGESTEVVVSLSTGATARRIQKYVTFDIEGHAPVRLPVVAQVIAYVTTEPSTVDRRTNPEGKIVVHSTDDQPFRILSADPPVLVTLPDESSVSHEITVSWELWEQMGAGFRRLTFETDHPKAPKAYITVRGTSTVEREKRRLQQAGVVQTPMGEPAPLDILAVAIRRGNVEAIEAAIKQIPEQPGRNEGLVLAARYGNIDAIKTLLDSGAEVNANDSRGQTSLVNAVRSRKIEAVQFLLSNGADVNGVDGMKGTALAWAAGPFGNIATVELLLKAGANANASDNNGMTPIIWAARYGDAERVEALVAAGADPAVKDGAGKDAADYAMARSDTAGKAIVEVLSPKS